jgi:DNA-binding transcriptional MerR regulator
MTLLTSSEAAGACGVTQATLRDWSRRGLLTNRGDRKQAQYAVEDLLAAMDSAKPRRARDTPLAAPGP